MCDDCRKKSTEWPDKQLRGLGPECNTGMRVDPDTEEAKLDDLELTRSRGLA